MESTLKNTPARGCTGGRMTDGSLAVAMATASDAMPATQKDALAQMKSGAMGAAA